MQRWLAALGGVVAGVSVIVVPGPTFTQAAPVGASARANLDGLSLPFMANQGQVDARVAFYAPTFAGTLFVTRRGDLVYSLPAPHSGAPRAHSSRPGWTLTETLRGGRMHPVGHESGATRVSHFLGQDPTRWRPNLPTYDQLGLGEPWPGVTVSLRARGRSVEKVFIVRPGGSVARIRVRVGGAGKLALDSAGALVAHTDLGPVTFTAPLAYQERDGVRSPVAAAYRLTGREYGFTVASYDPALALVIDPLLQTTYLRGSSDDSAEALTIHPTTGDVYVAGITISTTFPATGGGAQPAHGGTQDAFVARLDRTLTTLIQATYLGGGGGDSAYALAIHPMTGDVYVAGATSSTDFPHTGGGAQPAYGGGLDAFVARLNSALTSLGQATYLGGGSIDSARALAIDPTTGDVYVAGVTASTDFPHTGGGAQPANGGDADAFVARLNGALTALGQATYLGGSGSDLAHALAIHPVTGDAYVAGASSSSNFPGLAGGAQPTSGGAEDAFVARLDRALIALTQATYLGGSGDDGASALAIHPMTGDVYVAGGTSSANFPRTAAGAQPASGGGPDAFAARLDRALTSLTQATYLGGGGDESASALAIHPVTGDVYAAGASFSIGVPGTGGEVPPTSAGGLDAFVARLTFSLALVDPALSLSASVNHSTFSAGQTLMVGGEADNPGRPEAADFYVGIVRPDGSIQFFTSTGIVLGNVSDVSSFRPFAVGVPLGTPFSATAPNFYAREWTATDMRGPYVFFVGAVMTGALTTGTAVSERLLGLATAPFSFP